MTKTQHWQAVIQQWHASGLTQKQFCAEQDIKLHNFQYWLKKQRLEHEPSDTGFMPISVLSNSTPTIELHLGQVILKINLTELPDVLNQLKPTGWLHAAT